MHTAQYFALIGLGLDIVGVVMLASNELLTRRVEKLFEDRPGNPFITAYEATLSDDPPPELTEADRAHIEADEAFTPTKALRMAKLGVALVVTGFALQAVAVVIS